VKRLSLFFTAGIGIIVGIFGTSLGAVFAYALSKQSSSVSSAMMGVSSSFMIYITIADLIPESLGYSFSHAIIGIAAGIALLFLIELAVKNIKTKPNEMINLGLVIFLGIATHDFFEGLAVGADLTGSIMSGFGLAFAMLIHNVFEGLAIAVPLKQGGENFSRSLCCCAVSGAPTVFGTMCGFVIGGVSRASMALCLSIAAGAMIYVSSGLILSAFKLNKKALVPGFGFGLAAAFLLFIIV